MNISKLIVIENFTLDLDVPKSITFEEDETWSFQRSQIPQDFLLLWLYLDLSIQPKEEVWEGGG